MIKLFFISISRQPDHIMSDVTDSLRDKLFHYECMIQRGIKVGNILQLISNDTKRIVSRYFIYLIYLKAVSLRLLKRVPMRPWRLFLMNIRLSKISSSAGLTRAKSQPFWRIGKSRFVEARINGTEDQRPHLALVQRHLQKAIAISRLLASYQGSPVVRLYLAKITCPQGHRHSHLRVVGSQFANLLILQNPMSLHSLCQDGNQRPRPPRPPSPYLLTQK